MAFYLHHFWIAILITSNFYLLSQLFSIVVKASKLPCLALSVVGRALLVVDYLVMLTHNLHSAESGVKHYLNNQRLHTIEKQFLTMNTGIVPYAGHVSYSSSLYLSFLIMMVLFMKSSFHRWDTWIALSFPT